MLKTAENVPKEEVEKLRIKTDALLRETSTNYIRQIGDADRKARVILIVNSVFLTIGITLLTKSIQDIPYAWISTVILVVSNVLSLFFSIQSVKPEFKRYTNKESEDNIIHYKKCDELPLNEYSAQLRSIMMDNEKKMDAVIKDMYHYGNLLTTKYKMLGMAFRFFSWGIILAVISYLFILFIVNG
jgi:hypothetical protein